MQVSDEMVQVALIAENAECNPDEAGPTPHSMRAALEAVLDLSGWRTIDSAPKDKPVLLAAYIIPSEEAQRNGSQAFWHIGTGRAFGTKLDRWTNILGEQPTHWQPLPASPATAGKEG